MLKPLLCALLLAAPLTLAARAAAPDSLAAAASEVPRPPARPRWYQPRHLVLQTGGGLGMITAGAGYSLRDRLDADVLVGYVPQKYTDKALTILSLKIRYSPWTLPLSPKVWVKPLSVGGYISFTSGLRNPGQPGQYSDDYYWFSNRVRTGPLVGSQVSYALPARATGHRRNLSGYYELGTNDLYLLSYAQNRRALSLADIAVLTLGLKLDL
ncbi:hypothetical protein [Hymenobacter rubripertinctus]|uniref:Outer membrane protein beta-barrel domain-containing protein n=1 Tax=Hymenobacter rubripertinctus TaxID=2029981 RepID=A0A418R6A6_9BACT|nr:hypothetical protein [Hymenobacter rubripertinctus]RIY13007.1 hypothetical protein D0T11_04570 [Hymenobacter rubripertinctus]